jgi:hypothetical protein
VFIHKGKGKPEISGDALPIAMAVVSLIGALSLIIEGKTHHQSLHVALKAKVSQVLQILRMGATVQSRKR